MSAPTRVAIVLIPFLTLVMGWQLGLQGVGQSAVAVSSARSEASTASLPSTGSLEANVDLSLLWQTWETLRERTIEPEALDQQTQVYGAIKGLVESLDDPYTLFMTPQENSEFQEALMGDLQGIGAELEERDGQIIVVSPLKGSPAERARLYPEDVIVAVDGESIVAQSLRDVVRRIRGPRGTTVTLAVLRKGLAEPLVLEIVREDIHVPSVESAVLETPQGRIATIALNQFGDASLSELRDALASALQQDVKGLVLDLRSNGGGYLTGAADIASLFLPPDQLVVSVHGRQGAREEHRTKGEPLALELPMVILVNHGTASAAEILAGALQDAGRATLVGDRTFGKGSVQEIIHLPGGSSLRVTTARWMTPSGRDIGHEGIEPDLKVGRTVEDLEAKRDPQLEAALQALRQASGGLKR
jgi:carboxyl-terminal processing protease